MESKFLYLYFSGYYMTETVSELLNRYYIANRIVKSPVIMQNGCSFAIRINTEDMDFCLYVLEREKIKPVNVIKDR